MTDVYKQALCLFIQEGVLTLEQVQEQVQVAESLQVAQSRQTAFWASAEALCERLNDGIVANSHRPFRMNPTAVAHMEKLLRLDKITNEQAEEMIDWCLRHEFWSTVIFSPIKFRKHYDTMVAQRRRDEAGIPPVETIVRTLAIQPIDEGFWEEQRKRKEEAVPMPKDFKRMIGLKR